jgi:hypothetical protein
MCLNISRKNKVFPVHYQDANSSSKIKIFAKKSANSWQIKTLIPSPAKVLKASINYHQNQVGNLLLLIEFSKQPLQ